MKGKTMMAYLLAVILTVGILSPVYGAEITVGDAYQGTLASDGDTTTFPDEGSLPDTGISDLEETVGGASGIEEDSTDAVPDKLDETEEVNASGDAEGNTPNDSAQKDISLKSISGSLGSAADSLLTDSSVSDLAIEQETVVGSTYTSAVPVDGKTYYIRCASDKNYALTVKNSSLNEGANIVISTLTKSYNQKFMCRELPDGTYVFVNFHSGKAIRLEESAAKNLVNIWQYEFNSAKAGRWKLIKNSDGSYRIATNLNTNYVVDIAAGKIADNSNVQLYKWNKTNAQRFIFTETPLPDYSGTIQFRPVIASSKCIAPAGDSKEAGADVQLTDADNAKVLTYKAVQRSAGYYSLENEENGLVLTVKNSEKKSGAVIIQEKWKNSFSQQWLIRKNSDETYTYLSRLNASLAITPKSGGTSDGTPTVLSTYRGYSSQKYYISIHELSTIPSTPVYIRSVLNSDRVLDVSGGGTADGTNVDCYDWNETAAQRFRIEAVACGGTTNYWYKITGIASGKVLEVAGGAAKAGANIQIGTYSRTKAQLWHPALKSDGGYILQSALNQSYCLEMTGSEAYGVNVHLAACESNAKQKWYFTTVKITKNTIAYTDRNTVTVRASGTKLHSDTGRAYLFAINPYGKTLKDSKPLTSVAMDTDYIFHAKLNKDSTSSLLQKKFYVATIVHGTYTIISNGFYIQNPEVSADNQKAFPTPARKTKKGIKTSADSLSMAKNLNCSHVVLDLPIDGFLSGSDLAYNYEGKTYHFNSIINVYRDRIKSYNDAGIVVTGIFYMHNSSNTNYMYPSAASGSRRGSATLYALNTRNSNRKRLEALFACLADKWCTGGCTLANWIYGNELQQYNVYHYAGDISYSEYHEALAEEFRMFNAAIKSRWRFARTYISLDHNWNLSWNLSGTYNGMKLTSDFNTDLVRQGLIHWDMAMHPYPSPEQDCRFWNRAFTVTNSGDSQQITMLNARYFSSYIKKTYGSSTHVIMSETGLSSVYNGTHMQGQQAAAVAFAYYLAQFDPNTDMIAIHRDYDNSGETSGGWWLGIYNSNGSPKQAVDVFKYMDTKNWNSHVSHYMNTYIGSNWKSQINGFDADFFKNK